MNSNNAKELVRQWMVDLELPSGKLYAKTVYSRFTDNPRVFVNIYSAGPVPEPHPGWVDIEVRASFHDFSVRFGGAIHGADIDKETVRIALGRYTEKMRARDMVISRKRRKNVF